MSLINQVLTDLDARRAGGGEAGKLPAGVRPVPAGQPQGRPRQTAWRIAVSLGLMFALGAAWLLLSKQPERTAVAPAPVVATAAISSPTAPATTPADLSPPGVAGPPLALETSATLVAPEPSPAQAVAAVPDPVAPPPSTASDPTLRLAARLSVEPSPAPALVVPAAKPVPSPRRQVPATSDTETTAIPRVDKVARDADPVARARDRYQKALRDASQGRQLAALAGMSEALTIDPSAGEIRQTLLRMLLEQGDHAAAEQLLGDGLQRDPARSDWALLLSRLQLERGDQAAASALLDATLARQPGNAEVAAALGAVLHTQQRYAEAAQRYRRAIEIDGNNGRYWLGLALAHDATGAAGEARQAFMRALDSGTLSADLAAYARGRLR